MSVLAAIIGLLVLVEASIAHAGLPLRFPEAASSAPSVARVRVVSIDRTGDGSTLVEASVEETLFGEAPPPRLVLTMLYNSWRFSVGSEYLILLGHDKQLYSPFICGTLSVIEVEHGSVRLCPSTEMWPLAEATAAIARGRSQRQSPCPYPKAPPPQVARRSVALELVAGTALATFVGLLALLARRRSWLSGT